MSAAPLLDEDAVRGYAAALLPSLRALRLRRAAGRAWLEVGDVDDFVVACYGARGANVRLEVCDGSSGPQRRPRAISACALGLELEPGRDDPRLAVFLLAMALMRRAEGSVPDAVLAPLEAELNAMVARLEGGDAA